MGKRLSTGTDALIRAIEKDFGAQAKKVRAEYDATMREHRKVFEAARREASAIEREKLKDIERRRVKAVSALTPGRPVQLSDFASVKRETVLHGAKVSLARVSILEGQR